MGFFSGAVVSPRECCTEIGVSQFPWGGDGEREGVSQNSCQGKIGSLLICVYFTRCQVWMGMLWFTVTMTTEATPCPWTGSEPIHLSKCLKIPLCAFHGLLIQVFWQNVVVCSLNVFSSGLILFKSPNMCLEALFPHLSGGDEEKDRQQQNRVPQLPVSGAFLCWDILWSFVVVYNWIFFFLLHK